MLRGVHIKINFSLNLGRVGLIVVLWKEVVIAYHLQFFYFLTPFSFLRTTFDGEYCIKLKSNSMYLIFRVDRKLHKTSAELRTQNQCCWLLPNPPTIVSQGNWLFKFYKFVIMKCSLTVNRHVSDILHHSISISIYGNKSFWLNAKSSGFIQMSNHRNE